MPSQPHRAVIFVDRREAAERASLTILFMAGEALEERYRNVTRYVSITLVPRQHRQHRVPNTSRFFSARSARVTQRAIRHESVEQASRFQKIDEERQLPQSGRQRRLGIPFDSTGRRTVEDHALRRAFAFNRRLLTRRVKEGLESSCVMLLIMR